MAAWHGHGVLREYYGEVETTSNTIMGCQLRFRVSFARPQGPMDLDEICRETSLLIGVGWKRETSRQCKVDRQPQMRVAGGIM
jgi:hypothetical protein